MLKQLVENPQADYRPDDAQGLKTGMGIVSVVGGYAMKEIAGGFAVRYTTVVCAVKAFEEARKGGDAFFARPALAPRLTPQRCSELLAARATNFMFLQAFGFL